MRPPRRVGAVTRSTALGRNDLERARARAFRRALVRRVRGERDALAFVEAVGVCSTFYRFPEGLACLWEAVVGRRDPRDRKSVV